MDKVLADGLYWLRNRVFRSWQHCRRARIFWLAKKFGSPNSHWSPKFSSIVKVVKATLPIAHGSADAERGFSESKQQLRPDQARMEERLFLTGTNLQLNPKACIVIGKRIISTQQITVSKAIYAMLMSYFVFKIEYERETAPILDFLQRKLFMIEAEGSKTGRKKLPSGSYSHAPEEGPSKKYLRFMKDFKRYCATWNLSLIEEGVEETVNIG